MRNIVLLLGLLCSATVLFGQPIRGSSYETLIKTGTLALESDNYVVAREKLEEAYEKKEDEALLPILGYINYQLRDYRGAERYYRRYLRRADDFDTTYTQARFIQARILKMTEKPADAIPLLQQVIRQTTNDSLRQLAEIELTGAEMAIDLPGTSKGVVLDIMDRKINGPFSEYSPTIASDGKTFYFSTWNKTDPVIVDDPNAEDQFSRIFKVEWEEGEEEGEGNWGEPIPLGNEVNRVGAHTANPAISPDGRRLYYNRVELSSNRPTAATIYWSTVGAEDWTSGNPLEGVNGDYLSLQPAFGELYGDEVLFFVSDMPGGYGGLDIYYAPYQGDGVYGDPVNLGPVINTIGDDITPSYFDGTLFFSSNGHPSIGGFDIFSSEWNGSVWSAPNNLGKAYNTAVDDLSFVLGGEGYVGFMTSNRPGGRSVLGRTCCDNIYNFTVERLYADLVVGVFRKKDNEPLFGSTVSLTPNFPNEIGTPSRQTKDEGNRFDFGLELETPYEVMATHPDYKPDSVSFNTVGLTESKTYTYRLFLEEIIREPEFDTIEIEEAIVLENILYDFDDDKILPAAESDLQVVFELMTEYPEMIIELGSHTDARGEDRYNRDLSQRRMESARRWLQRKGIERDRINAKGYGETVPQTVTDRTAARFDYLQEGDVLTEVYINQLETEEQQEAAHQLNRRTEFKILEGPTSIIIRRERLRKRDQDTKSAPDRNTQPEEPIRMDVPQPEHGLPIPPRDTIHPLSSLHGIEDLSGLPIMQFNTRLIDLGAVKKGETRSFEFEYTNVGSVPLTIALVQACDCTTTEYDTSPLAPGESAVLKVTFDSSEKDEPETIDIDFFLENLDKNGTPIMETVQYRFSIDR